MLYKAYIKILLDNINVPSRSKYHVFRVLNNFSRLESLAEPTICPMLTALFFLTAALRSNKP